MHHRLDPPEHNYVERRVLWYDSNRTDIDSDRRVRGLQNFSSRHSCVPKPSQRSMPASSHSVPSRVSAMKSDSACEPPESGSPRRKRFEWAGDIGINESHTSTKKKKWMQKWHECRHSELGHKLGWYLATFAKKQKQIRSTIWSRRWSLPNKFDNRWHESQIRFDKKAGCDRKYVPKKIRNPSIIVLERIRL